MASESSSSQQSQQLLPSSKVNFMYEEGIIAFNNVVALLKYPNELYRPMLSFISNCCINKALTLQPSAMYVEYLKEFWYTADVEEETKTITFLLSWWDKPLSFTQDEFIPAIGLPICKDVVPLPPKETIRAGLATLGLFNKDKPTLSSTVLVNSSPLKMKYFTPVWKLFMQYIVKCLGGMQGSHDQMNLKQQTIAYCLIWGLEIDIRAIIFSDLTHKLQNGKKNKELNIFYTRFLSLIYEELLGEKYISNDLTLVKPHTITAASFQKPLASEEVNADDTSDKSLSRASMQLVTQHKAPTDLKTKKNKNPPYSKPKSPYKVRVILPKKQVAETSYAEVTVATANATQCLEASKSAEEQVNQPTTAESEKESGFVAIEDVTFEHIMDEFNSKTQGAQEKAKSPYDTESEIKIIKSYQAATISGSLFIHQSSSYDQDDQDVIDITPKYAEEGEASESLSGLRSMPDNDLASMPGFETQDSVDHVFEEGTETLHASADKPAQSDPLGHVHEELCLLNNKVNQLESNITKHVSDSIQSTMPLIVTNTLKEQLPGLLSDALKDTLPQLIKDSIKSSVLESIAKELPHVEAQRFVLLRKEMSKSLHNKMRKSIRLKVQKGMKEVRDKLSFCTSTVDTNSQYVQDLWIMFKDMVSILEAAEVFKKANAEGEKWDKNNPESPAKEKDA
ncbi:hypothetical protein Tco_0724768 [Tanacetum coccineum]|uniref:Aminotransferase-like plant mobile domain-containing protein n=1 Tax=Tanacetum coccineum TaxID=301880 RepID=A0ABQ4YCK3_9ASTR